MKTRDLDSALRVFRDKGGTLRTRDLIASGVHTDALYALRESGQIVELDRGLYRLADISEAEYPDLAVIAARAPNAAVCLISALSYHDITTQIASSVHLAYLGTAITGQAVDSGHGVSLRSEDVP
jgi:predicted transcriptional regulator of viral defense system